MVGEADTVDALDRDHRAARDSEKNSAQEGRLIRQARQRKGLSQQKLAELMGISRATVQQIESGQAKMTVRRREQVQASLDLDLNNFQPPSPPDPGMRLAPDVEDRLIRKLNTIHRRDANKIRQLELVLDSLAGEHGDSGDTLIDSVLDELWGYTQSIFQKLAANTVDVRDYSALDICVSLVKWVADAHVKAGPGSKGKPRVLGANVIHPEGLWLTPKAGEYHRTSLKLASEGKIEAERVFVFQNAAQVKIAEKTLLEQIGGNIGIWMTWSHEIPLTLANEFLLIESEERAAHVLWIQTTDDPPVIDGAIVTTHPADIHRARANYQALKNYATHCSNVQELETWMGPSAPESR